MSARIVLVVFLAIVVGMKVEAVWSGSRWSSQLRNEEMIAVAAACEGLCAILLLTARLRWVITVVAIASSIALCVGIVVAALSPSSLQSCGCFGRFHVSPATHMLILACVPGLAWTACWEEGARRDPAKSARAEALRKG
jgi:hypothetical protein